MDNTATATQPTPDDTLAQDGAAATAAANDVPVALTPKAVRMVKITREDEGMDETYALRVAVRGGGCSGFEYALDFDNETRDTDHVYEQGDLKVVVDPISARYLAGTTIDYLMGAQGAGFKFENPNAVGSCGCGSSFAV